MRGSLERAASAMSMYLLSLDTDGERFTRSNPRDVPHEVFHLWAERFLSFIQMDGEDNCWQWLGATSNGYGCFSIDGDMYHAHRVCYEVYKGRVPAGMEPDHLCRNRGCVNPRHIEVVTFSVNMLRAAPFRKTVSPRTHCRRGHKFAGHNAAPNGPNRTCRLCREIRLSRKAVPRHELVGFGNGSAA